jgi:hypothetical protein
LSGKPDVGLPDTSGLQSAAPLGSLLVYREVYGAPEPAGLQVDGIISRLPICLYGDASEGTSLPGPSLEMPCTVYPFRGFESLVPRLSDLGIFGVSHFSDGRMTDTEGISFPTEK